MPYCGTVAGLGNGPRPVQLTQSELAAQVGTAREVVSRRLENWAQRRLVRTARGQIELCNCPALQAIADAI
jgi:CRP/FNR family transcriptional regulator